MSKTLYAIVPLTLERWSEGEDLSADCLNDLYKFCAELKKIDLLNFKPYESNMLRFRTTEDPDFTLVAGETPQTVGGILLDSEFLYQIGGRELDDNFIEIEHLTARKLLDIVLEIHRRVSELSCRM